MPVRVIVNPAAGQGACGKAWPEIEAGLRSALGDIDVTIKLRDYPADARTSSPLGPFTIDTSTTKVDTRARGRQVAINLESSGTNDSWRFGTFRAGIHPSGRR